MTRRTDELLQGHTEPGHQYVDGCVDDNGNFEPVQKCHHSVDESKRYSSSDNSVDSGIGSKDGNLFLSEIDMTNENSTLTTGLDTELSVRNTKIIPYESETANKCEYYKRLGKPNYIHIFLSISVVGNIVLVVVVTLLATKLGSSMEADEEKCPLHQLPKVVAQESLCIPCDYLGSRVTAEDTLFDAIFSCGYKFCCVENAALQKLFLLMLQNGYTSEVTTELLNSDVYQSLASWRSRNIAAHLYANVTSLPEKLTWQTYGSAFTQGITVTPESRLKVPRAGFYFVYSAVTFKCQTGSMPLIHLVNRQHRSRPNTGVLQLLLSKTSECGPGGIHTSFLADAVHGFSEGIKMTGTTDMSQDNNTLSQLSMPLSVEEERETHHTGRIYCCQVDDRNMGSSVDNSLGSRAGRNYPCHCQLNTEQHEKTSLYEDSNSKVETLTTFVKTGEKRKYLKRFRKLKCFYISLLFSFALNIGLITTAACLGIKIGKGTLHEVDKCPLQQLPREALKDAVCIPCDYFGSTLKAEDTLFNFLSSCGYRFCCVRNARFQKFLLLVLSDGYTKEAASKRLTSDNYEDVYETLETWRSRDIAAHLYANVTSLPEKLTWQTEAGFGSAFLSGITLTQESRLMVPRAGYYFIYSAVTFTCQDTSKPRLHLINRQHKERPKAGVQQLLLSKSSDCGPDGSYTSFLSGVLELKRHDEISVSLTNDSLSSVYTSSLSNFFGVYVI